MPGERSPLEAVHLADQHYRRSFGRSPDKEMRDFIKTPSANGLTAAELLTCMTAAVVALGFARMSATIARFSWLRHGRFGR